MQTIDLGVYCGYCVDACPEDAIRMDTGILGVAAYSRDEMKLDELMDPRLRKPLGDARLKFPHECRLAVGQTKGSWNGIHGEASRRLGWSNSRNSK